MIARMLRPMTPTVPFQFSADPQDAARRSIAVRWGALGFAAILVLTAPALLAVRLPALPLFAVIGIGGAGALLERVAIRPMLGESPIAVFMVTVGLASILVGVVELIWTSEPRRLPEFMPATPVMIGEAFVPPKVFYGFLVAAVLIGVALAVFRFWRGGVALRATASDQQAAYSMGIDVPKVFSLSWTVAAMIAAIAGVIVGAVGGISSTMGVFGLSVLVVVIVGGLDSVLGALVAGLLIGVVESLAGGFLGGEYKLLATFLILIVVLLVRPYGLFGTHEIERL